MKDLAVRLAALDAAAGAALRVIAYFDSLTESRAGLQDRIAHVEHLLGWPVREPDGKLRLQLALALRRLRRRP